MCPEHARIEPLLVDAGFWNLGGVANHADSGFWNTGPSDMATPDAGFWNVGGPSPMGNQAAPMPREAGKQPQHPFPAFNLPR
jgi:hypothetical protein